MNPTRDKTDFERGAIVWHVIRVGSNTPYRDEPEVNHPEGLFIVGHSARDHADEPSYVIPVEQTTTEEGHDVTRELADHICAALNAYSPTRRYATEVKGVDAQPGECCADHGRCCADHAVTLTFAPPAKQDADALARAVRARLDRGRNEPKATDPFATMTTSAALQAIFDGSTGGPVQEYRRWTADNQQQPGVWMAYYTDTGTAIPYPTELDALRRALGIPSMDVVYVPHGKTALEAAAARDAK